MSVPLDNLDQYIRSLRIAVEKGPHGKANQLYIESLVLRIVALSHAAGVVEGLEKGMQLAAEIASSSVLGFCTSRFDAAVQRLRDQEGK